jgi:predicted ArsR family transcriptional regulator
LALSVELRNTYVVKKAEPDKTRDQVARTILEGGPATAAALSEKLKITAAGIRRHLDSLVSAGVLMARDPFQSSERSRGRPSKVFVMTDLGREKFEHSYDDLAVAALKFMASKNGEHLVNEFATSRADDLVRKGDAIKNSNKSLLDKSKSLAKLLTKEGYSATTDKLGNGEEICQHHCPIAHVASEFPQLCEAETKAFSEILGTHVQRLATIAHGDGVCTTFVPTNLSSYSQSKIKEGARK